MKPTIALLLALFMVACGGSSGGSSGTPATPTAPTMPTVPTSPAAKVDGGQWAQRSPLIEPNSELALAELNGKLYLLGGYPANRQTARTVQVYDIASDSWQLGPPLPQPNNHGMAAGVNGKIYLIGGQTMADAAGPTWTRSTNWIPRRVHGSRRRGCPRRAAPGWPSCTTARSTSPVDARRAEATSPSTTRGPISWQVLPDLPTQRNHFTGAAINGRIHFVGGRQGDGLSPQMTTAHEVFDPQSGSWTTAAPMLRARSGMNGVMARGCFHVWGGEGPAGMFPDHDYYDPRTDQWITPPRHADPRSRRLRVSLCGRSDLGLRRRHQYRRQPRQLAQPGLLADSELRVTPSPSCDQRIDGLLRESVMKPVIALLALFISACARVPGEQIHEAEPRSRFLCGRTPRFRRRGDRRRPNLFAYDVNAPLNLQKAVESTNNGVEVSTISFSSPDGGSVTGLLFDPVRRSSLRPGIVLMHGLPGTARAWRPRRSCSRSSVQ